MATGGARGSRGLRIPALVWALGAEAAVQLERLGAASAAPYWAGGGSGQGVPYSDRCPPVAQAGRGCLSPRGHTVSWAHPPCPPWAVTRSLVECSRL